MNNPRICEYCGEVFIPTKSTNQNRFCSRTCYWQAKRKHHAKPCAFCGDMFIPQSGNVKHCSHSCAQKSKRTYKVCKHCGATYLSGRKSRDKFCSHRCYASYAKFAVVPRKGKDFTRATKRLILNRDQHQCVICGATAQLQIDHVIPAALGGDNYIWNGQTLCVSCHNRKSRRQRKIIMSRPQP